MNDLHPSSEQLVDYLHGELGPVEDATIHAHLIACSQCADARNAEASLTEMLRTHARSEERELPPGVVMRVHAAITGKPQTLWTRLSAALRPAIAVPVAVAVALLCYAGVNAWRGDVRAATVDAAAYVNSHTAMSGVAPFSEDVPIPPTLASDDGTH